MPCLAPGASAASAAGASQAQALSWPRGPWQCCGASTRAPPVSPAPPGGASNNCWASASAPLSARRERGSSSTSAATNARSATSSSSARTSQACSSMCEQVATTITATNSRGMNRRRSGGERGGVAACASPGGEWEDGPRGVRWSAADLAEASGGEVLSEGDPGCIVTDTRQLRAGDWFLALRGPNFDGNAFLGAAREAGCAGAVAEGAMPAGWDRGYVAVGDGLRALQALGRWVRGRFRGPVVGITGSMGKSTATALTQRALQPLGPIHKTAGNLNNHVGVPLSLLAMSKQSAACVLELGMSAEGEIAELAGICQPGIRVVLNVGPAHLDSLGTLAAVARAKGELLASARPGDTCVLNADDPLVASLPVPPGCRTVWFGYHERANVQVVGAEVEQIGTSIRVTLRHNKRGVLARPDDERVCAGEGRETEVVVRTPLVEVASLCAAAVAAAVTAGVPFPESVRSLSAFAPPKQRMHARPLLLPLRGSPTPPSATQGTPREGEHSAAVQVTLLDDCYNANPISMGAALRLLLSLRRAGVCCHAFLGDMLELGPVRREEHQRVLHTCAGLAAPGPSEGSNTAPGAERQGGASAKGEVFLGLVGPHYRDALESLRSQGWELPGVTLFATEASSDMAGMVRKCIEGGVFEKDDIVLVKGSRGMRMDLVVDAFLEEAVRPEVQSS